MTLNRIPDDVQNGLCVGVIEKLTARIGNQRVVTERHCPSNGSQPKSLRISRTRSVLNNSGLVIFGLFTCVLLAGCTRSHYRRQADVVASDVVSNGTASSRFEMPGFNIGIDSRSRLYDPSDPDFPPMPPDDEDAHRLMISVDGHRGWKYWDKDGVLDDVEINDYRSQLPYDSEGKVRVNMQGAMELARMHSRDYQLQLETLYLSALDVTASRFTFNCQFYGGNTTVSNARGPLMNGGTRSSSLTTLDQLQLDRTFVTGGTLVAAIANSIVWQFGSGQTTANTSLLSFAMSQPILQYAGRPYVMEVLTRAERGLLGNIRQFARYRQGFYMNVVMGNGGGNSVVRIGGLSGGSGLTSFTGVGVGGFGGIGAISGFSTPAASTGNQIAPGGAGGYWYFLQTRQQLRNLRTRNARLRETWLQLSAAFDAGRLDNRFQVDFARQAYYEGQSVLLTATTNFQNFLDAYKTSTLGLPPQIPLEIDDPLFEQFNLIDPDLTRLQEEIADRLETLSAAHIEETAASSHNTIKDLSQRTGHFIDEVSQDLVLMDEVWPRRRQALIDLTEFPELKESHFDNRALTPEVMEERVGVLKTEFPRVSRELTDWSSKFDRLATETELEPLEMVRAERAILAQLSTSLLELSLLQARARLHGITTIPIRVTPEVALQVALTYRPDWMNAKASLVDSWRLIRYNASALKSNLTVNFAGTLGTTGNNPVKFSGTNGQLIGGVTFDPPLTRILQRNVFRESLIEYQQSRRNLMGYRDEIFRVLRTCLRQIRLNQLNLELRRLAVDVAITQTDVARLKLIEPEKPVTDPKQSTTPPPTLARDLVDALTRLLDTQQQLIFTWGDYESQRRQLDFALGTMELDGFGMWIDPGAITDDTLLEKYYEAICNPLSPAYIDAPAGKVMLSPSELPPEPGEADLPVMIEPPSPE